LEKEIVVQKQSEIIVKNKGQITIPVTIRKKYKIDEGTRLKVVATKDGVLLKPQKTFWDMVGAFPVDSAKAAKMDKQLYDLRHEENDE
jgi:AbrB family looped-hinge helix DNA binding protein